MIKIRHGLFHHDVTVETSPRIAAESHRFRIHNQHSTYSSPSCQMCKYPVGHVKNGKKEVKDVLKVSAALQQ